MLFFSNSPQSPGQPSGPSQVIKVDPAGASTTNQTLGANSGLIFAFAGIGIASDGTLPTANVEDNSIVRIDLTGPTFSTVSSGGCLTGTFNLPLAPGDLRKCRVRTNLVR